jgi:hypothetical protein
MRADEPYSPEDYQIQRSVALAKEADPTGKRTLGKQAGAMAPLKEKVTESKDCRCFDKAGSP